MRVKKIFIENYKAIASQEIDLDGKSFFLIGGNGVGKTSAGSALIDLLEKNFPSNPVKNGERSGYIEFLLDDGSKLFAKLENGEKARIYYETVDGFEVATTAEVLKKFSGDAHKFNIDDFLRMQPKPRRELLQKLVGLDLEDINEREKMAEEARRVAKIKLKEQQGRIEPYDEALVEINEFEDADQYLTAANNMRLENQRYDDAKKVYDDLLKEIVDLENRLEGLKKREQRGREYLNRDKYSEDDINFKLAQYEDAKKKINEVEKAKRLHKEFLRAQELEESVKDLDEKILKIRKEKNDLIHSNPLPADGLQFDESGDILLNGLPFESNQISTSAKVIAGLQLAESMLGKIKYIHFDASVLDKDRAREVLTWADSKGLQLCLERAEWDGGPLTVEIVDGEL